MATPPTFSSGAVLTAAQMNSVGMWLVSSTTIGSAVSTVNIDGCFTSDYRNYLIVFTGANPSGSPLIQGNWRSGGVNLSGAGTYQYAVTRFDSSATAYNFGSTGSTYFETGINLGVGITSNGFAMYVYNPQSTSFETTASLTGTGVITGTSTVSSAIRLAVTTTVTGVQFRASTGTITGGTIRVYGLRD